MKTQINIKSALFGLFVGVLAVIAIGAETAPNQVGRYRLVTGTNNGHGFALTIDTETGQVYGFAGDGGWPTDPKFWTKKE
jgi:hypothetical protein